MTFKGFDMTVFTSWQAQGLTGNAVLEAQRCWLGRLAETLSARLRLDSSQFSIGECLSQLMSGLLQSLVSAEEAVQEQGLPVDALIEEHNLLCEEVLELTERHERGELVGLDLLELLHECLGSHEQYTRH